MGMPLKVCLHISGFGAGGAERQIVNLARELDGRGIHVILLHAQKDVACAHYLEAVRDSGVEIINGLSPAFLKEGIELSRRHTRFFGNIPAPLALKMGILFFAGALARIRPDILHSYLDGPNCMAGCAAVLAGTPAHLASFRHVDPQTLGDTTTAELTLPLYRYLLANTAPHFEANSKNGGLHYARWLDINPDRIAYTPNGLDPDVYLARSGRSPRAVRESLGIPADAPTVLTLARFAPEKAPETMLNVFARIQATRPDIRYIIAGTGMSEKAEMGEMVRARGLAHSIHLLGVRSDVAELLSCADVFLLPSRLEGFPNVLMEAMAVGVPVVASNVGGIPDLVRHGQNGFLHEAEDVAGMARSVVELLDDGGLRAQLGVAGKHRVLKEFSLQKLGDRALKQYEELLAETNPRT